MAGGGEMTDVVVDEVGRRQSQALIAARAVEGRGDPELQALRPDRVVVVLAVEGEHVVPDGEPRRIRIGRRRRRDAPRHAAAEHAHLRAELTGDVLELRDGLVRRVHRDDRGRGHPVAQIAEVVRGHDVVRANHRAPGVVVVDPGQAQAGGRIDDREIGAELVAGARRAGAASWPLRGRACSPPGGSRRLAGQCAGACARRPTCSARRGSSASRRGTRRPPCRRRPSASARRRRDRTRPSGRPRRSRDGRDASGSVRVFDDRQRSCALLPRGCRRSRHPGLLRATLVHPGQEAKTIIRHTSAPRDRAARGQAENSRGLLPRTSRSPGRQTSLPTPEGGGRRSAPRSPGPRRQESTRGKERSRSDDRR